MVGTKFFCCGFLAWIVRKCCYLATPGFKKEQGHVTQSSNTYDSNAISWFDIKLEKWIKYGYPSAKKWPGSGWIQSRWNRQYPFGLGSHPVGKATIGSQNRWYIGRTKILVAGQTAFTYSA